MQRFHPAGSLAPRDVAARAIYQTMLETGEPCVYLDITHKPAERQLLPAFSGNLRRVRMERGIDLTKEPIPVVPAAHYSAAGASPPIPGAVLLWIDCAPLEKWHALDCMALTAWPALPCWNRLVWGTRAGATSRRAHPSSGDDFYFSSRLPTGATKTKPADPALIFAGLADHPAHHVELCGLDPKRKNDWNRAMRVLRELDLEIARFYEKCEISDSIIGLRNGILTALLILARALLRGARPWLPWECRTA